MHPPELRNPNQDYRNWPCRVKPVYRSARRVVSWMDEVGIADRIGTGECHVSYVAEPDTDVLMRDLKSRAREVRRDAADLLRCLLRLGSLPSAKRFIRDLMTEDEIRMIVARWRVARSLADGLTYRKIEEETGLSSRTIARISRWLRKGEGGYRLLLRQRGARKA